VGVLPFEGSRTRDWFPVTTCVASGASREVRCVSECWYATEKRVYWVPRSRSTSPFLTDCSGSFLRLPSPKKLAHLGFILSYALRLYRVLPFSSPPRIRRFKAPSLGLRSLIATSTNRVQCFEHPIARRLAVLDVFHVLDGFLRSWPCGFISPHCHVQGSLFRGLLLVRSRIAFQRSLPSRRCPNFAKGSCPPSPLRWSSPSGLSSASESGSHYSGVSRVTSPFPS